MNNREKATLIWLSFALAAILRNRAFRGSLGGVVQAFVQVKILAPLLAFIGWVVSLIALASLVGLWEADLRNDAVTWFLTAGFAFCFSLSNVTEDGFLRRTTRRTMTVTVFVEGFVNLAVFGLVVELVLLPVLAALVVMAAFTEGKPEYAPVQRLVSALLTVFGVCAFVYVSVRLARDFDADHTLRALALPVWLTMGSLPFVYAFGLWAAYERAFSLIEVRTNELARRHRAKRALLLAANVRASEVGGFAGHWIGDLVWAESARDARVVTRTWRTSWRAENRASRMSAARAFMHAWLSHEDPALMEVHADALHRSWDHLDGEQRAALKAEGLSLVSHKLADAVQALPD